MLLFKNFYPNLVSDNNNKKRYFDGLYITKGRLTNLIGNYHKRKNMVEYQRGTIVLQGGSLPKLEKEGAVVQMDTYQILSLLFLGGNFLIALFAYIDRNNKRRWKLAFYASSAVWRIEDILDVNFCAFSCFCRNFFVYC